MNRLPDTVAPRMWRLLAVIGGVVFLALLWVSLPLLFDLLSLASRWTDGLLPNFQRSWEALLWFR